MKKKAAVLVHDYWHSADSIKPLMPLVFGEDFDVVYTTDPDEFLKTDADIYMSFKDPVENDQIPTPVWCGEQWTADFLGKIRNGAGFIALHAAVTDLPEEHEMAKQAIRAIFLTHPEQCPLSFEPRVAHPLLEGIKTFAFPQNDEHYMMRLCGLPTEVLAVTRSSHGEQPALWTHALGSGKIICITPAHTTENLTFPPFVKLLKNAVNYCVKH